MLPPLGCPFHPRCPKAFEICGWESRDLRTLLEEHWTTACARRSTSESADLVGDLDALDEPATEVLLPAGDGHTGEDAVEVLERVRERAPEDPFWRGIASLETEPGGVRVRFHDGRVPRHLKFGDTEVSCHLHDETVLAEAPVRLTSP